ncbi:Protein scribble [Chlorella vulgaris]
MHDGNEGSRRAASLLHLPTALHEAIFSGLDLQTRAGVLPLVCSTFRRLLSGPSACLWPDIVFDADTSQLHERARALDFLNWLRRHAQHSRTVELDLWNGGQPPPPAEDPSFQLLGERLTEALATTLQSCEFLRLRWGGPVLVVGDWVSAATCLTCLALSTHNLRVGRPLAALTSLVHLELSTVEDLGPVFEPGCLPASLSRLCCVPAPAEDLEAVLDEQGDVVLVGGARCAIPDQVLALPRLAYLDVSESIFSHAHLAAALPRLRRLTSLAFDKCDLLGGVPREMAQLTALRVLSFDGCGLYGGGPGGEESVCAVLPSLARLVSLSISNCRMAHFPPPLAATTSLQHLYIEFNRLRVLPPGPFWRQLRVLSIDWEPLLRCHTLLAQAPHLHKLALGCQSINPHGEPGLPPVGEAAALCDSLRAHPALQQVLLIARPGGAHGTTFAVMEAMLSLRSIRPGLEALPIQHDTFFVEEPAPLVEGEDGEGGGEGGGEQAHAQFPPQPAAAQAQAAAQAAAAAQALAAAVAAVVPQH